MTVVLVNSLICAFFATLYQSLVANKRPV